MSTSPYFLIFKSSVCNPSLNFNHLPNTFRLYHEMKDEEAHLQRMVPLDSRAASFHPAIGLVTVSSSCRPVAAPPTHASFDTTPSFSTRSFGPSISTTFAGLLRIPLRPANSGSVNMIGSEMIGKRSEAGEGRIEFANSLNWGCTELTQNDIYSDGHD